MEIDKNYTIYLKGKNKLNRQQLKDIESQMDTLTRHINRIKDYTQIYRSKQRNSIESKNALKQLDEYIYNELNEKNYSTNIKQRSSSQSQPRPTSASYSRPTSASRSQSREASYSVISEGRGRSKTPNYFPSSYVTEMVSFNDEKCLTYISDGEIKKILFLGVDKLPEGYLLEYKVSLQNLFKDEVGYINKILYENIENFETFTRKVIPDINYMLDHGNCPEYAHKETIMDLFPYICKQLKPIKRFIENKDIYKNYLFNDKGNKYFKLELINDNTKIKMANDGVFKSFFEKKSSSKKSKIKRHYDENRSFCSSLSNCNIVAYKLMSHIYNVIKIVGYKYKLKNTKSPINNIEDVIELHNPFNEKYTEYFDEQLDETKLEVTEMDGGSTKKHPLTKQYKHSTHKRTKKRRS